jgi:protein lifeguard
VGGVVLSCWSRSPNTREKHFGLGSVANVSKLSWLASPGTQVLCTPHVKLSGYLVVSLCSVALKMASVYESIVDEESGYSGYSSPLSSTQPKTKSSRTTSSDFQDDELLTGLHISLRRNFMAKVYGLLSCQLLMTVIIGAVCMESDNVRMFVLESATGLLWGSVVVTFGCLFTLSCFKDTYPVNYALLALFTFGQSVSIGVICSIYAEAGAGDVIFQAFCITAVVFISLTLFASQTQIDFTPLSGALFAILVSMLVVSVISGLFGFSLGIIYSWLGALVFCGFIMVDTQLIMNRLEIDDYIMASIELYLDIINLFLFVLQILTGDRSRRNSNS